MEEFDERLDAAYKARTYGELEPLTADLPVAAAAPAPLSLRKEPSRRRRGGRSGSWAARRVRGGPSAIMGGFQRKGRWTIGRRFTAVGLMGGGEIDLREANFAGPGDRDHLLGAHGRGAHRGAAGRRGRRARAGHHGRLRLAGGRRRRASPARPG